jgi:hypothetical protein
MNVGKTTIRNNEIGNNAPVPFIHDKGLSCSILPDTSTQGAAATAAATSATTAAAAATEAAGSGEQEEQLLLMPFGEKLKLPAVSRVSFEMCETCEGHLFEGIVP